MKARVHSCDSSGDDNPSLSGDSPVTLRERATRLLARREYSQAELARKLAPHAGSPEALLELLEELGRQELLSDQRYAEQRTAARSKKLGNARLAQELRTKGVEGAIIDTALDALGDEATRAQAIWHRKYRGIPPANREEWARQARFLQSRGFPSELIRKLLDDPEHFPDTDN